MVCKFKIIIFHIKLFGHINLKKEILKTILINIQLHTVQMQQFAEQHF